MHQHGPQSTLCITALAGAGLGFRVVASFPAQLNFPALLDPRALDVLQCSVTSTATEKLRSHSKLLYMNLNGSTAQRLNGSTA
eukprot:SAG11_NODE_1196_length_5545_cov_17.791407_5_plen_83_part_00